MSTRSAASANPILTNYAQGLAQETSSALAEFLAPTVPVDSTIGHFKKYDDKNMYQVLDTGRAVGGPARRIEFDASDPTYNCKPQALEITIDDSERDSAGIADPIIVERAKTRVLVNTAVLSHENKVLVAVKAGISAVADRGNWSSNDIDPIDQIDEQIKAIADATGFMPNRMCLGIGAWYKLRGNAKVKARVTGVKVGSFNTMDFSASLLNPGMEIRVGTLVKDATLFPKAKSTGNIVGDECFIFFANPAPDTYDASFAKTFRGGIGSVDSVRVYRDEKARSDVLALDWSEDIKVVYTACCKRLTIT